MTLSLSMAIVSLTLAAIPVVIQLRNRVLYRSPQLPRSHDGERPAVSVLIPARDEQDAIDAALGAVLASKGIDLEVVVLDDNSRDETASRVRRWQERDPRVRLATAPPLPEGWCGKQHACDRLARLAKHETLVFIDADVRLEPDGLARAVGFLESSDAALVSGIPRQVTGTFLERLLIPLIHFILLGYLPMWVMRRTRSAAFGAGCGQLFVTKAVHYHASGGHAAIRASLHDGVMLPRAYRRAGLATDLFDATDIASCRMYHGTGQVLHGLLKNATEGMASIWAIMPWSILLLGGQVLPWVLLAWSLPVLSSEPVGQIETIINVLAAALGVLLRLENGLRFAQSLLGAVFHPLGVALLVTIQWYALVRRLVGIRSTWRGRAYPAT